MKLNIKNNIDWIGKTDWDLRKFHGNELSTHRGSTYNSYLIREEKTVLIDTVWMPFAGQFIENLSENTDLKKIDYIITNHAEIDHSGALPALMELIPETPIYCTENGVKSIRGHYHKNWNFHIVKTGDTLAIGSGKELIFLEMKMLHWPDSMACYLTKDNVLFSNDAFGQHLASGGMFNDLVDQAELFTECMKYYANIITPFSAILKKKLDEILALNLKIDIIAPSHGVIWRTNPAQIVEKYVQWCRDYQENQITVIYDTMWNGTRIMAERIIEGIKSADASVCIKCFNITNTDKNDIITEVFKSKMLLVGSPTVGRGITSAVAGILEEIEGLGFKNKKASGFGCYGWSGESPVKLTNLLGKGGFSIVHKGIKCLWNPDADALLACEKFGNEIAGLA